jgi:hypothetical protein
VRLGWSSRHLPTASVRNWVETPHGEGGAQPFPGHLDCGTGHKLAVVDVFVTVMPLQSPLGSAAGNRGLDDHRVHGGRSDVEPFCNVGNVLFPLVLPKWCEDLSDVPRHRHPFFNGIDAPSLCKAMVDYGSSQVRAVLDGLDDRELTVVGEQLRRVDALRQGCGLGVLAAAGEGEVGPLCGGAPGPVGVGGHRDLLPGSGVELSKPR